MAEEDKDKEDYGDDEYQFTDLDTMESEPLTSEEEPLLTTKKRTTQGNLRRNAIIALVLILFLVFMYNFLTPVFKKKPQNDLASALPPPSKPQSSVPNLETASPAPAPPPTQAEVLPEQPSSPNTSDLEQRLSVLESNQQNVVSEIETIKNKLQTLSSSLEQLPNKLNEVAQSMANLTLQVEQQSKEIAVLTVRPKPVVKRRLVIKTPPLPHYFIQAVIPGRAWLIAQNGSTITVREGTRVPGYGVIKLIDSSSGRIITSSGKIIQFSQQDS